MKELELLSLLTFMYENRADTVESDRDMREASEMLQEEGHITLKVDTCSPIKIDTSGEEMKVLVLAVNKYQPQTPIRFHVSEYKDMETMSLLNVRGMSRYTYSKSFAGPMRFPRLHGGEVLIEGDVEIQSITDSVAVSDFDALMTSFIVVSGTVLSCGNDSLEELMRSLRVRIQLSSDERMFGMLLVGESDHALKYEREDVVRTWSIRCTASQGKLTVQVMHLLR